MEETAESVRKVAAVRPVRRVANRAAERKTPGRLGVRQAGLRRGQRGRGAEPPKPEELLTQGDYQEALKLQETIDPEQTLRRGGRPR